MKYLLFLLAVLLPSVSWCEDIWSGTKVFPTNWTGWEKLDDSCFSNAVAGKLLRFKYNDLKVGASATLYKSDWTTIPGIDGYVELQGNHVDIPVTQSLVQELKRDGCIVFGQGFTMTSVQIIGIDEVSRLKQSVPLVNDWLWTENAKPRISIDISNPTNAAATANAELIIQTDKLKPCTTLKKSVAVSALGNVSVSFDLNIEPGFYQCTALVNDELARTFTIGYAPERIVSPPDMQPDFHTFWQEAKAQLATTPMDITMSVIPSKSTPNRTVYLIEVRSVSDQTGEAFMRAYYAEPTGNGTYPALIHFLGHDTGNLEPYCMGGDDLPGYAEMYVSIRGQFINNRPPFTNPYGKNGDDYFIYGFGNKENYYYRGAFLDAVRAVDFLCTREKVQNDNIFAEGSSQGGTLAIAAAALSDGRVKAIAPSVFFMSDFPNYFQITAWPGTEFIKQKELLGMTDEEMYKMLSYFDMKNLATMIHCPVYMNFSLHDDMCPPYTNWVFYNNLASTEKKYLNNPTLGHQTPDNWWSEFLDFFADYMNTEGIEDPQMVGRTSAQSYYNLDGRRLPETPRQPGIYINNGKKVLVR